MSFGEYVPVNVDYSSMFPYHFFDEWVFLSFNVAPKNVLESIITNATVAVCYCTTYSITLDVSVFT